jgi:F-box/WD-40 domain protein MET30
MESKHSLPPEVSTEAQSSTNEEVEWISDFDPTALSCCLQHRRSTQNGSYKEVMHKVMPSFDFGIHDFPGIPMCTHETNASSKANLLDTPQRIKIGRIWQEFSSSTSQERELILLGLLDRSCSSQITLIHAQIQLNLKFDILSQLPIELGIRVLSLLDAQSVCRATPVCRSWSILIQKSNVWQHLCHQHIGCYCRSCGWGLPVWSKVKKRFWFSEHILPEKFDKPPQPKALKTGTSILGNEEHDESPHWKRQRTNNPSGNPSVFHGFSSCSTGKPSLSSDVDYPKHSEKWKNMFFKRYRLERNWRRNKYVHSILIPPNSSAQTPILACCLNGPYLMTAGMNGVVHIWNVESKVLVQKLIGHRGAVTCVFFDESKYLALSGGVDGTVRLWNYVSGVCVRSLPGGSLVPVTSLHFDQGMLVAADAASLIRIWDFEKKTCFSLCHGNLCTLTRVILCKGFLYSAGNDGVVRMWDLKTRSCIRLFIPMLDTAALASSLDSPPLIRSPVTSLHVAHINVKGNLAVHILTGSSNGYLNLFASSTSSVTFPKSPFDVPLSCTPTSGNPATACRSIQSFYHGAPIVSVWLSGLRAFSTGEDGQLRVWDIHNGVLLQTFPVPHSKSVVAASDTRVVCARNDGMIKMWDFHPV